MTATTTVETFPPAAPARCSAVPASPGVDRRRLATAGRAATAMSWAELAASDCYDRWEEFLTPTPLTALDDELARHLRRRSRSSPRRPGRGRAPPCATGCTKMLTYETGATGVHTSAVEAYAARRGVCQDISHLAIGTAAVDGHPDPVRVRLPAPAGGDIEIGRAVVGESHAWIEWYDGAWNRFDPTNLTAPGQAHVVVGRGRDYAGRATREGRLRRPGRHRQRRHGADHPAALTRTR